MPSSTTTLNYFGMPGRAEAIRLALTCAGKDFEDKKLTFPEYGASKWAGKGLPVLEMDGVEYTQSTALLRYAGKIGGLLPEDPLTALKVDEIVMMCEDQLAEIFKCFGQDDDTVAKKVMAGKLKTLLEVLTKKLEANSSSEFCVGDSLTIADFMVHAVVMNTQCGAFTGIPASFIGDVYPRVMAVENAVMADPKVKLYYESKE